MQSLPPEAEAVEIEIDHRRGIERKHLAYNQPTDDDLWTGAWFPTQDE